MISKQIPESEPLQTFNWTTADGPSHAIVMAITEELDSEPVDFDPLHTVVDADALDSLFGQTGSTPDPVTGSVQFDYLEYRVVIKAHGRGYLYERDEPPHTESRSAEADE